MIQLAFRSFVGFAHHTGAISYSFAGAERLGRPGQLIVANHPSLMDIVLLIAFTPGAGCVVKREAWRNPAMVIVVSAAGYVPNAPTDLMIERAAADLSAGECLITHRPKLRSALPPRRGKRRNTGRECRDSGVHMRRAAKPVQVNALVPSPEPARSLRAARRQ
jgi:hypothetical protein